MFKKQFTNETGLTLEVVSKLNEDESPDYTPIMGGDNSNPTWEEYMDGVMDDYKPHFLLIREVIEANGWVGKTAEELSNDTSFKFSDGQHYGFSWRAWGDLMQVIVDKREGYMTYYM
jgi:hypothetical protein